MDENAIFHFTIRGPSGESEPRCVDPFKVERLVAAGLGGERLGTVVEQAQSMVGPVALMAQEKLLGAIRGAFEIVGVQPDGGGATEKAQLRVWKEYQRWKAEVKKNTAPSATDSTSPMADGPPAT